MKEIVEAMESLTPRLEELEKQMTSRDFSGKNAKDLLGSNPQLTFSRLVEFKVALDRMRGLTWVYMEAAENAGRGPVKRMPQALKEFLQQQATKTQSSHAAGKKTS